MAVVFCLSLHARSVAGTGVDILSLRQRWDKFELMLESHAMMIKEQVLASYLLLPSRNYTAGLTGLIFEKFMPPTSDFV